MPVCIIIDSMSDYLQRAKYFRTKKRLGQNFLVNPDVIASIIDFADIKPDDVILEIGPGIGFVTEQLVKRAKKVFAVELDEEAIAVLKKIDCDNLEIIHQDILKTDLSKFSDEKIKVVANIPYYITSPIIAHLLGEIDDLANQNRNSISSIILMVQEEVAHRIVATPDSQGKEYGLLSILSQFWADCSILKLVGRRSFYPAPKVNSALVQLEVRETPRLELSDYKHFRRTIKAGFAHRRKTLKNCLLSGAFAKEAIEQVYERLSLDANIRGEKLSIEDFGCLSEELINVSKNQDPGKN